MRGTGTVGKASRPTLGEYVDSVLASRKGRYGEAEAAPLRRLAGAIGRRLFWMTLIVGLSLAWAGILDPFYNRSIYPPWWPVDYVWFYRSWWIPPAVAAFVGGRHGLWCETLAAVGVAWGLTCYRIMSGTIMILPREPFWGATTNGDLWADFLLFALPPLAAWAGSVVRRRENTAPQTPSRLKP